MGDDFGEAGEVEQVSKVVKIVFVTVATGLVILPASALKLILVNMVGADLFVTDVTE